MHVNRAPSKALADFLISRVVPPSALCWKKQKQKNQCEIFSLGHFFYDVPKDRALTISTGSWRNSWTLFWIQNANYSEMMSKLFLFGREREGERWKRSWVVGRIPNEAQQRSDTSKPVKNDDDATGQQAYPIPLEKFYFIPFNTRGSSSLFFSFSGRF